MCLAISPKFFKSLRDSKLWSSFKVSLHSLTRSKSGPSTRTSDTRSEKTDTTKSNNNDSSGFKARFKKYNFFSSKSTGPASASSNDSMGRSVPVRDDDGVEICWKISQRSRAPWDRVCKLQHPCQATSLASQTTNNIIRRSTLRPRELWYWLRLGDRELRIFFFLLFDLDAESSRTPEPNLCAPIREFVGFN